MKFVPIAFTALALSLAGCGPSDDTDKAAAKKPDVATYGATDSATDSAGPAPTPTAQNPADAAPAAPSAQAVGDKMLEYPDDMQMTMLAYRLTARIPPLEDWAKESSPVKSADEFSRAARLKDEIARLKAIYDSTAGVGFLTMKMSSNFSQYDSTRGGYYLDAFSAGSVYSFNAPQRYEQPVSLQLDNSLQAQFWPMGADAAKALLEKNGNARYVSIVANIAITGTQQRSTGVVITGHIKRFTVFSNRYNSEEVLGDISPK